MVGSGPGDVFDVLRSRASLLGALSEEAKSPADLTTELSLSRSTVDRALRELERVGFVEVADGVARVTLSGRLAIETHTDFVEELDEIGSVGDLLESLPQDAPFDPVLLNGSGAVVADGPNDQRPLDQMVSFTNEASSIRGCVLEASEALVEACYRCLHDDDVPIHLVATDDVVQRLISAYRPQLVELLGFESFSLRSIDSLPYTLLVVELPSAPVAVLGIYDAGRLVGVVYNRNPRAVQWARTQLDHCWADSESLPISSSKT